MIRSAWPSTDLAQINMALRSDVVMLICQQLTDPACPEAVIDAWVSACCLPQPALRPGATYSRAAKVAGKVAQAITANPVCTPQHLDRLIQARRTSVRAAAMGNPNLTDETWRMVVSRDRLNDTEIQAVLNNPAIPRAMWERLASGPRDERRQVAGCPFTPEDLIVRLVADIDARVAAAAIHNPNLPSHLRAIVLLGGSNRAGLISRVA